MGQAQILSLPPQISYYLFPEPQFVISKMGRRLMAPIYGFRIKWGYGAQAWRARHLTHNGATTDELMLLLLY